MLCCAVLLALVGIFIRRGTSADAFPTPASWTESDNAVLPARRPATGPPAEISAKLASVMFWTAIGALVYVAAVTAMLKLGAADRLDRSDLIWYLRDAAIAVIASSAIAIAVRSPGYRLQTSDRRALSLIGAGLAWLALGIFDQHVLLLFEVAHGLLLWDAVFHAAGVWAIAGGFLLLNRSFVKGARSASGHTTVGQVSQA